MKQIMKSVQYSIYCKNWKDTGCGYEDYAEYKNQKDAVNYYIKIGWRTVKGEWICPKCTDAIAHPITLD